MNKRHVIEPETLTWVSEQVFAQELCKYTLEEVMHGVMYLAQKLNTSTIEAALLHKSEFESDITVMALSVLENIQVRTEEIYALDSLEVVPITIEFSDEMISHYSDLAKNIHYVFRFMPLKDVVLEFLSKKPIYAVEFINGSHTDTCVRNCAISYFQMLHVDSETLTHRSESEIEKEIWIKYWREQNQIVIPLEVAFNLHEALSEHKDFSRHVANVTANQFAYNCAIKPELTNLLFSSFVQQHALPFSVDRTKYIGEPMFADGYEIEAGGSLNDDIRVALDQLTDEQESQLMDLLGVDHKGLIESLLSQPALYFESLVANKSWLPSRCLKRLMTP